MLKNYDFFTTDELRPAGWLKRQLELQRDGLNGNLDKVWPDIRDSKWIGGDREGWERVPYWLDGFIPLAYLLDDDDMKARAKRYIDKIIENQEEDGWICPNGETPREKYDTWAIILISKVLVEYYRCSKDARVPDVLYKTLKNYHSLLSDGSIKLFAWGAHRWYELFVALDWLKGYFGAEEWMYELGRIAIEQGTDYEKASHLWEVPLNKWTQETHIVNLTMMIKSEALVCRFFGGEYTDIAERFYKKLKRYNGTPVGIFTGDECLSGLSPIQGSELCSVVELMYSLEQLYAVTGDSKWADKLELVAFNALPATISDDMWTHQYDQLSNQISCLRFEGKPIFRTNNKEAHLFGLEPHYGCCTSNFGQGWPKLALSAFMRNESEVVSAVPIPSELSFRWGDVPVSISLQTNYPFENTLRYTVHAESDTDMTFRIRLPESAKSLKVNGEPKRRRGYLVFKGFARGETVIEISFETEAEFISRPYRLAAVKCGSLIFAAPIKTRYQMLEYTRAKVERKYPYCDYMLHPESEWNFAFASRELSVKRGVVADVPFSSEAPAVTVQAELCHIDWGYEDGYDTICAKKPRSRKALDAPFKFELYPYGCAKLRMTELPFAVKEK